MVRWVTTLPDLVVVVVLLGRCIWCQIGEMVGKGLRSLRIYWWQWLFISSGSVSWLVCLIVRYASDFLGLGTSTDGGVPWVVTSWSDFLDGRKNDSFRWYYFPFDSTSYVLFSSCFVIIPSFYSLLLLAMGYTLAFCPSFREGRSYRFLLIEIIFMQYGSLSELWYPWSQLCSVSYLS